jgi:uncharacterized tellurite resistance protein B-like protein
MFDSLKHWFDSLKEESKLFEHREDEILHSALASVLYHVISADQHVDSKEKHEFERILKQEFDLDDDQVEHLYHAAKGSTEDVHGDLHTINHDLHAQANATGRRARHTRRRAGAVLRNAARGVPRNQGNQG